MTCILTSLPPTSFHCPPLIQRGRDVSNTSTSSALAIEGLSIKLHIVSESMKQRTKCSGKAAQPAGPCTTVDDSLCTAVVSLPAGSADVCAFVVSRGGSRSIPNVVRLSKRDPYHPLTTTVFKKHRPQTIKQFHRNRSIRKMQRSHNNRANLERRIGTPFHSRRHDGMHGAGTTTDVAGSLVDWPFNSNPASSPSSQQHRLYSPLQSTMASGFSSTCSVHTDQLAAPKSRDELWEAAAVSWYYCSHYATNKSRAREKRHTARARILTARNSCTYPCVCATVCTPLDIPLAQ